MNIPTTLLFIRHGQVFNPDEIYYGKLPGFPLSRSGVSTIRNLAQALKAGEIRPDLFYYSPTQRTRQTSDILTKMLSSGFRGIQSYPDRRLFDINNPGLEGRPFSFLSKPREAGYEWETVSSVVNRMSSFVFSAIDHHEGQTIGIVTHQYNIAFVLAWMQGEDFKSIKTARDLKDPIMLEPGEAYQVQVQPSGSLIEAERILPYESHRRSAEY